MSSEQRTEESGSDADRFGSVLLYDGECAFCSAASRAVQQLDETGVLPWEHPAAQSFLVTQFGEAPFALMLIDGDAEKIWAGRAAAQELCARAGMPSLVEDIVAESYDGVADAVRRVSGLDRDPDPYHGTYELTAGAKEEYAGLIRAASDARELGNGHS